jgi:hypothetical protein
VAPVVIFLSDGAYEGLVKLAREAEYIRGEQRSRGLSKFMYALVTINPTTNLWLDKRPASIKEILLEELEEGLFPTWDKGDRRWPRPLGVEYTLLPRAAELALELGVIKSNAPGLRGRGDRLTVSALSSQFWEAVGIGWLQPVNPAPVPLFRSKARKKREEDLVW